MGICPFWYGTNTDLRIFSIRMKLLLEGGENSIAERGYPDEKAIKHSSEANMYSNFNAI